MAEAHVIVDAVRSLVDIMREGGITRLDLAFGDVSIRLQGGAVEKVREVVAAELPEVPDPLAVQRVPAHEQEITSPMVGTFYSAPTPGSPPFVRVGDHVEVGQTVGIIEAMKIMNEIAADRAGLVTAVLVENSQPVEYGSPLIRVDPTRAGVVTVVASAG